MYTLSEAVAAPGVLGVANHCCRVLPGLSKTSARKRVSSSSSAGSGVMSADIPAWLTIVGSSGQTHWDRRFGSG
ncbi:hypothetical protein [Nonomuraea sp. LPB2021202275-12-8]|uniref:hypothetical protein n=1 Tax=Nonomuraea sp. LPB2021202275-12-8 TaxID=3120159 RepID=UPI00300C5656